MKYIAKIKTDSGALVERVFQTEKEARIWAFGVDGELVFVVLFGEGLSLLSTVLLYQPRITDNRN